MAGTKGSELAKVSKSHKAGPSPDWSLQLDSAGKTELDAIIAYLQVLGTHLK